MDLEIDLVADLNAEDDDGLGWATLSDARDASQVRPGAMLIAGNRQAKGIGLRRVWSWWTRACSLRGLVAV